jgi:elongation factor Ts
MSDISAEKVKELREKSGAGMMECKRALSSTGGDISKAIDLLRKEGVVKAAKKAGRATLEGLIAMAISPDKKSASLVEVNCETDFVARTDQFLEFISAVAEEVIRSQPKSLDALLKQPFGKSTLQESLAELISKVGENMSIRRFILVEASAGEAVGSYQHAGSKIGVLVKLKGAKATEALARDVAMHVAAMSPHYIHRKQVPATTIEREKEIAKAAPDLAGKPAHLLDKILEGKLNRYYSDACLVEQPFVRDPSGKKAVGDFLREAAPDTEVLEMVRYQVGEAVSES